MFCSVCLWWSILRRTKFIRTTANDFIFVFLSSHPAFTLSGIFPPPRSFHSNENTLCVCVCLSVCLSATVWCMCDVCIFDCPAICYFIDGMGLPMDIATNHGIGGPLAANHLLGAAAMGAINNMAGVHDNRPPPPPHSSLMQMTGMDHNAQCVCSTVA